MIPSRQPNISLATSTLILFVVVLSTSTIDAFAPVLPQASQGCHSAPRAFSSLKMIPDFSASSSSIQISATTLDPTTVLSDVLGGVLGSPAILLVPIVAAFAVGSLIAFLIVSYANPQVEDDE